MRRALERDAVAALREKGFSGTFPHFRRRADGFIDLVSFQFDKRGGGFCVEIGVVDEKGIRRAVGFVVARTKVTAHDIGTYDEDRVLRRWRLGARRRGSDHWYRYDRSTAEARFEELAEKVTADLERQAERFWSEARA